MSFELQSAPEEVAALRLTHIFSQMAYTHLTSHTAREGIAQTGKIMAPRIALAHDVVPFSGETAFYTYFFRAYHVSVSSYPHAIDHNTWRHYLAHGMTSWSPEGSATVVEWLEEEKKKYAEAPFRLRYFLLPGARQETQDKIDGCIEIEKQRQRRFAEMNDAQRHDVENPQPELYVFDERLRDITAKGIVFGQPMQQVPHPFIPAEINLRRYLIGMFTSLQIDETRAWIARVIGREVPVGSLNALATWEDQYGINKNKI